MGGSMANLLTNGDFTADWGEQSSHRAWVCKPGVTPQIAQIGNIFTPPGWDTWFRHEPGEWDQPEVRDARSEDRLFDGHKSQLFFTFFRRHWGGFLQHVAVEPGKRYRLTAWAHAWSNSQNGPHVDDPRWSEGPGYGAGYVTPPLAENVPPPAGPGTTDDWRNFAFNVGLDPTGGVNPFDASVRWGPGASIYNQYGQVPAVEVTATGPIMTVWLRSRTLWAFKHNDAYWGAASLELVEPEPEPPEPCQCIGLPRTQYARTYNVVPANATEEQAVAVFLDGWRRSRETTGGSYDDAGIGDLDVRRARLYGIPSADRPDYEAFYAAYYPGVEVEFAWYPGETEPDQGGGDIALSQNDPRWRDIDLGEEPGGETIGQAGCLLTTLTMMLRQCGETDATPPAVNKILADAGTPFVEDDLLMWPEAVALFDCFEDSRKVNRAYTAAELADLLADGWLVGLMRADGKHFVYLESIEGDAPLHIIDPWDGQRKTWTMARVGGIRAALIRGTTPEPEPPATFNPRVLTLHLQSGVEAMQRFVTTCKPAGIKTVLNAEMIPTLAALNPGMRCVYRGMDESEDPQAFIRMHIDTLRTVADQCQARGLPLIDGHYFWFELWNEVYGFDREPNIMWRDRELAAVRYLAELEPRVGTVAFNAGVGNIHPPNFDVLVPLAQAIQDTGGMFGLHSYFGVTPTRCTMDNYQDEGRWLESRFEMTDDYLTARGIRVNWFLSEGGAIYYQPPTNMPYSSDGWRHPNCLNGNWLQYLARLEQLAQHLYQWNTTHGGRCKGYSLFTSGSFNSWKYFELGSAEIDGVAAMQVRLWPL